mgnify:CR=1 FL=1
MFILFEGNAYNVSLMRNVKIITIPAMNDVGGKERTYFVVRADYGSSHTDLMQTYDRNAAIDLIVKICDKGNAINDQLSKIEMEISR